MPAARNKVDRHRRFYILALLMHTRDSWVHRFWVDDPGEWRVRFSRAALARRCTLNSDEAKSTLVLLESQGYIIKRRVERSHQEWAFAPLTESVGASDQTTSTRAVADSNKARRRPKRSIREGDRPARPSRPRGIPGPMDQAAPCLGGERTPDHPSAGGESSSPQVGPEAEGMERVVRMTVEEYMFEGATHAT